MQQMTLNFDSKSPINAERLKGQNKRLFDYLAAGNSIHCFHPAMKELRIGYLNSRISDIRKVLVPQGRDVFKKKIKAVAADGELTDCKLYSLTPFEH